MKKKIIPVLISLFITSVIWGKGWGNNPENQREPDALIPSTAILFVKFPKIEKAISALNESIENFNLDKHPISIYTWINMIRGITNIDILDNMSLKRAGINVEKSIYLAYLGEGKYSEKVILFIPIIDEKKFPLMFVRMLKMFSGSKKNLDLNPAITMYKKYKVFQVLRDIFFTTVDGYFVITSSGGLLKQIIDIKLREGSDDPISEDLHYAYYKKQNQGYNDFDVFIRREFINKINIRLLDKRRRILREERDKTKNDEGAYNGRRSKIVTEEKTKVHDVISKKNQDDYRSRFDFIEYIAFGLRNELDKICLNILMSVDKDDAHAKMLMNMFVTGMSENAIFVNDPSVYNYLSVDMNVLKSLRNMNVNRKNIIYEIYHIYHELGKLTDKLLGLNLEKELLPFFEGTFNLVVNKLDNRGGLDKFILYFPMKESSNSEILWEKIKVLMKSVYEGSLGYGEEKIDNNNSFWIKDKRGYKIYFLVVNKDFYIGKDIKFIREVLGYREKTLLDMSDELIKKVDENTFLYSYSKLDMGSLLRRFLVRLISRTESELYVLLDRIDYMDIIGKRVDNRFSFDISIVKSSQLKNE